MRSRLLLVAGITAGVVFLPAGALAQETQTPQDCVVASTSNTTCVAGTVESNVTDPNGTAVADASASRGGLPLTGGDAAGLAAIGAATLVAGGGFMVMARRRRLTRS